jgi:hypothetical protein
MMAYNDKDSAYNALQAMNHGEKIYLNWHEEGGAEVHRIWDMYFLFEIPQYGGDGRYHDSYYPRHLSLLIEQVFSWN